MLKTTTLLDPHQKAAITNLVSTCCQNDSQQLSYPFDEAASHYLLYNEQNRLISALAITPYSDTEAECSAFTLPKHRQNGHFTHLLAAALNDYEETDLLFACTPACPDTLAVLQHLEAEPTANEHQMEYTLTPDHPTPKPHHPNLTLHSAPQADTQADGTLQWQLSLPDQPIGSCLTTRISDTILCLHQFRIEEPLRGQGFGSDFLLLLFAALANTPFRTIILQVSGDNTPAISLYTKTGFRITRTLSYYYY